MFGVARSKELFNTPRKRLFSDRDSQRAEETPSHVSDFDLIPTPSPGRISADRTLDQMFPQPIRTAPQSLVLQTLGWRSALFCKGCKASSIAPDPVVIAKDANASITPQTVRKWVYPDADGPRGQMCWYCSRVYMCIFKPRGHDWNSVCQMLQLLTGYEFCVFFHQLESALVAYKEGRQRYDYAYECPLPDQPVSPKVPNAMSQTTELSTHQYLHLFCAHSTAELPRAGHGVTHRDGHVTFTVPTGQLLLIRAQIQSALVPMPSTPPVSSSQSDPGSHLSVLGSGGAHAVAEPPKDEGDSDADDHEQRRRRKSSGITQGKKVGYAKQTLSKVSKLLEEISTMKWGRDATERAIRGISNKMTILAEYRSTLDKLHLRGDSQTILIKMTTATRQLTALQDMFLAFRQFHKDISDGARPRLLEALASVEVRYASALAGITMSTAVMLEVVSVLCLCAQSSADSDSGS